MWASFTLENISFSLNGSPVITKCVSYAQNFSEDLNHIRDQVLYFQFLLFLYSLCSLIWTMKRGTHSQSVNFREKKMLLSEKTQFYISRRFVDSSCAQ